MVNHPDFLWLPYSPDLTDAGVAYACRSLAYTYDRVGGSKFERMRRIAAGIAVELALRRYLLSASVPHDVLGATHFTEPDRYDISLGGRRCDLKSYLIYRKSLIRKIRRDPGILLNTLALVPSDQIFSDHYSDDDIYIFSFLNALVTHSRDAVTKALEAKQPVYMIHPMPKHWAHPANWQEIGPLVLKTNLDRSAHLIIGGQTADHQFQTEGLDLASRKRTPLQTNFHSVNYLHVSDPPEERIGIYSPVLSETYIVKPTEWENIWLYGMEILIVGYMTRGEFRRKAVHCPIGTRVLQYAQTRIENMAVPVSELHPMDGLFIRAQNWSQRRP